MRKAASQSLQKALIADDEEDVTYLVKTFFEYADNNLKIDQYNGPILALQNFRKGIYNFIPSNIKMTQSGIELYKKIWDIDKLGKIFIFMATDPQFEEYKKICSFEDKYFI